MTTLQPWMRRVLPLERRVARVPNLITILVLALTGPTGVIGIATAEDEHGMDIPVLDAVEVHPDSVSERQAAASGEPTQSGEGAQKSPPSPPDASTPEGSTQPEAPVTASDTPPPRLQIAFDMDAPAVLLGLSYLDTVTEQDVEAWVQLPGNREILAQGMPIEHLRGNAWAVIEERAIERDQPMGAPGTLRMEPKDHWRWRLIWLDQNRRQMARGVAQFVTGFLPPDFSLPPTTVYFHLGGGWDARTTDAIYVNVSRILDTQSQSLDGVEALVGREVVRLVQRRAMPDYFDLSTPDQLLFTVAHVTAGQGMMRFVQRRLLRSLYPEGTWAAEEVARHAENDRDLEATMGFFDRLVATASADRLAEAESLMVRGVRSEALSVIGDLVCRTIFSEQGAAAVGECLTLGPVEFFQRYAELRAGRDDLPKLPIAFESRLPVLAAQVQRPWLEEEQLRRQAFAALDAADYAAARAPLERLREIAPGDPIDVYNLACVQAVSGELEAALESLATAIELGFVDAAHMRSDPDLASLRGLVGFERLLEPLERASGADEPGAQDDEPDEGDGGERGGDEGGGDGEAGDAEAGDAEAGNEARNEEAGDAEAGDAEAGNEAENEEAGDAEAGDAEAGNEAENEEAGEAEADSGP